MRDGNIIIKRIPPLSVQNIDDPVAVLDEKRIIEMIKFFITGHGLLRDLRIETQAVKEISRGRVHQPESKKADRQEQQDRRAKTLDNMFEHSHVQRLIWLNGVVNETIMDPIS
jgi:hypothetical protein